MRAESYSKARKRVMDVASNVSYDQEEIVSGSERSSSSGVTLPSQSKRPKYTKFTQQELPACKPMLTPIWVLAIFMTVAIVFIPIGACALAAAKKIVELRDQYDIVCIPSATTKQQRVQYMQDISTNKHCTRNLEVTGKMKQPIYVYYQLDNFYQNHRRYVKSRSDKQLKTGNASLSSLKNCDPEKVLNGNIIVPCGLVAWTLFNDTYSFKLNGLALPINKQGIAWKSDVKDKFGNVYPSNFPNNFPPAVNGSIIGGGSLDPNTPLSANEDLIVWMRTAALPSFRKLWGKIERDLYAGDIISVDITNVYNTYSFRGQKSLVISTTGWLGGKNKFLGIAYLVIGGLSMLMALTFFVLQIKTPRPLGDASLLSWNKKKAAAALASGFE